MIAGAERTGILDGAAFKRSVRIVARGVSTARQDALLRLLVNQPFSLFATPVNTSRFEALDIPKALLFCQCDHSADCPGMTTRRGRYE